MTTRRQFLGALALPVAGPALSPALFDPAAGRRALEVFEGLEAVPAAVLARDEALWFAVQQAFTVDRSQINFNNGGVSPSPLVVQEAMQRHLAFSNQNPPHHMWHILEPQKEPVRARLARMFGCDTEEIAITRNASESLQTCQFGLDLEPGDELLTTTQDYGRMLNTFRQREKRDGVKLVEIELPVPCEDDDEVVRRFEAAMTERTRVILMCHVINLTGQILPVKRVVQMARAKGVPVIVDGAHSFAHFEFSHADLDCDYYGTSLHKWLFAPHGTGLLYVRKNKIADLWPLMAPPEKLEGDIRKFEEIGTHPAANILAIGEAIGFHLGIGPARKEARLRYLRDLWAKRLLESDRVRLHTSLDPRFSCGIANVEVLGVDTAGLQGHLWREHKILTVRIDHEQFEGLRVSPSVYTTLEEIDRFCGAVETVIRDGLPA